MIDKTIARLIDAVSSQADNPRAVEALRRGMGEFASSLPFRDNLTLELIVQSLAEAAEELPLARPRLRFATARETSADDHSAASRRPGISAG